MSEQNHGYKPDWIFFGDKPRLRYQDRVASYQADQHLKMTSQSRAQYEERRNADNAAQYPEQRGQQKRRRSA